MSLGIRSADRTTKEIRTQTVPQKILWDLNAKSAVLWVRVFFKPSLLRDFKEETNSEKVTHIFTSEETQKTNPKKEHTRGTKIA